MTKNPPSGGSWAEGPKDGAAKAEPFRARSVRATREPAQAGEWSGQPGFGYWVTVPASV